MMAYEKLDAWKSCHALVLAVFEATRNYKGAERQLIGRLTWLAFRAPAKLAFGKGSGNRRMFLHATARVSGYLSEFSYVLSLVRVMSLLSVAMCDRIDALRGRAAFYVRQLLDKLMTPPG
jgi:hypothetical protein